MFFRNSRVKHDTRGCACKGRSPTAPHLPTARPPFKKRAKLRHNGQSFTGAKPL